MKHLFIINPVAGGYDHTPELKEKIDKAFSECPSGIGEYEIYLTKGPMDAAEEIKRRSLAAPEEELRVYACGGDGTFNECVCGAAKLKNVAVVPCPVGTGNDMCRMFGEEASLFLNLPALIRGSVHPIDLIDCNGRYSANICSVGIDARVGTNVHKYTSIPFISGSGAYILSTIVEVLRGISMRMKVDCGDYHADRKHTMVCVCNGRFYGGGYNPVPGAMPDDRILDILVVQKVSLFKLAAVIGKYAAGKGDDYPEIITHVKGTAVDIELDKETVVNIDGEAIHAKSIHMELVPGALNFIVPEGMKFFEAEA